MRCRLVFVLTGAIVLALACAPAAPSRGAAPGQSAAAPAAGKPTTVLELAAYQGPDRQQLLEEGARREGKVTWYTTLAAAAPKALAEAFERQYPYVKVDVFRATSAEILTKISEELQARRYTFDTLEMTPPGLVALREAQVLAPFFSPSTSGYAAELREPAPNGLSYWAYDRESYIGFGYNTSALPAEVVPKTYRDLLHPALRGKMAIAGTDTGSRLIGNMLAHHGEDLVQQFARQDVTVQMISGAAVMDLVASGEVPASPSVFRSHAQLAIGKGAPVRWVPLEPVTANAGGTALSANAPHPHAAMLWVDFALGEEGQRILQELDYDSPAGNPGFQRWYPEAGLTAAEIERKLNQWEDIVKRQLMRR